MSKSHKALEVAIRPYGLVLVKERKHYAIRDQRGNFISSVSHSPSDPHFARQTVRELVKVGRLPEELKRVKF